MTNVTKTKQKRFTGNIQKKYNKVKAPIVEALQQAYINPTYQFHIPGHTKGAGALPEFKRLIGSRALNIDTTDVTQPTNLTISGLFTLQQGR